MHEAMLEWFGTRRPEDDEGAFSVVFGERLYPDDIMIVDLHDAESSLCGLESGAIFTSLERKEPGAYQEQDIFSLLRRIFPSGSVFLNPIRHDTGKELCDILVVADKILILIQAKDSPNTEAALRRSIDRKKSTVRGHIEKGARQLRGALVHCLREEHLLLKLHSTSQEIHIANRKIYGLIVVQELFGDDRKVCSLPVLKVAQEIGESCVLLDYPELHMLTLRLNSPERFCDGLDRVFDMAMQFGEYPKSSFFAASPNEWLEEKS